MAATDPTPATGSTPGTARQAATPLQRKQEPMSATPAPPDVPGTSVELEIGGMTCASCANRIERKLNKLDGVTATVNYATEKAKVTYPGSVSTDDLLRTVEAAGYEYRAAFDLSYLGLA